MHAEVQPPGSVLIAQAVFFFHSEDTQSQTPRIGCRRAGMGKELISVTVATARIPADHRSFNRVLQVAPLYTPSHRWLFGSTQVNIQAGAVLMGEGDGTTPPQSQICSPVLTADNSSHLLRPREHAVRTFVMSIRVCLSVCLSAGKSRKLHSRTAPNFCACSVHVNLSCKIAMAVAVVFIL